MVLVPNASKPSLRWGCSHTSPPGTKTVVTAMLGLHCVYVWHWYKVSICIFKWVYKWRWAKHYWVPLRCISGFLGDSLIIQSAFPNYEQATNSKSSIITYHMPANIHSSLSCLAIGTMLLSYKCIFSSLLSMQNDIHSSRHKAWMLTCFSVLKQWKPSRALQEKVSVCVCACTYVCVCIHALETEHFYYIASITKGYHVPP